MTVAEKPPRPFRRYSADSNIRRTLTTVDDLDRDIMRLGGLEAADFRDALRVGGPRQTPAVRTAAEGAGAEAAARWEPLMAQQDERARSARRSACSLA